MKLFTYTYYNAVTPIQKLSELRQTVLPHLSCVNEEAYIRIHYRGYALLELEKVSRKARLLASDKTEIMNDILVHLDAEQTIDISQGTWVNRSQNELVQG